MLGGASLISRVLGLVRDRLLTHTFGAGAVLDAYYAAFRLPDFLYNLLILGALSAAFIPLFTEHLSKKSREDAWRFVNTSLSTLGIIFLGISVACILASPILARVIAPGFTGDKLMLTIRLTQIMMISPVLMGLSSAVGGALQALKKFLMYAFAPIMYNAGIIFGLLVLVPLMGPIGLAWGVILGAAAHLFIQVPTLISAGYRPRWQFDWNNRDVRTLLTLMGPRTFALATAQINFVVITVLASQLTEGSVAIFNLANNIQSLPIGIIGVSYAVAAFPSMSEYVATENPDGFARTVGSTLRMVMLWLIPVTVLFLMLHMQWVRIILGSGKFDWRATIATGDALGYFAIGLLGQGVCHVLARAFYALQDTWTPAWASMVTDVLGIVLALVLMRPLGVPGLALAYATDMTINALLLWIMLRKRTGPLEDNLTLHAFYKLCGAALIMALVVQGLKGPLALVVNMQTLVGVLTQTTLAACAGLIAFVAVALLLNVTEIFSVIESLKRRTYRIMNLLPIDVTDIDRSR